MNSSLKSLLLTLLAASLLSSCSNDTENDVQQPESYETQSAKIGHEAAQAIKVPMENAQDAVDLENERTQEYEKRLSE
jgi:type IV pilus biogenesis protein CpaD/CtpE